jgi:hypothetical protein
VRSQVRCGKSSGSTHSYGPDDRVKQGYECFPALATLIRERYELKEEVAGVRIFALRKE